jgi:hypothetical protein
MTVAAVMLTARCSGDRGPAAASVASQLLTSVQAGDGAAACATLAPDTAAALVRSGDGEACDPAVLEAGLPRPGAVTETAGHANFNQDQSAEGLPPVTFLRYLTSARFGTDVAENWQSEYLQFFLYITATVWLLQRGSPESKSLDKPGLESDRDQKVGEYAGPDSPAWASQGGFRLVVYSNSLGIVMAALFLGSWLAQSISGVAAYSEQQLADREDPITWTQYLVSPDFWNRTLQNWQSELLAVASMAISRPT